MDAVFEKQITMPLVIPYDLEQFIHQLVSDALSDAGLSIGASEPLLIPVHEQGKGTAILPDLQETVATTGNIRFWVIGNQLMWAGIDRRIDEAFEVLWTLFHLHNQAAITRSMLQLDKYEAAHQLAQAFRSRLPAQLGPSAGKDSGGPQGSGRDPAQSTHPLNIESAKRGIPGLREALLFRQWAFHNPVHANRHYNDDDGIHSMFDEESIMYPFPDELFWKDGDEGEVDGDGVPQWHDVESDDGEDGKKQPPNDERRKRKRGSTELP